MKRKAALGTGILTMVLCLAMGFTAYAQGWEQDGNGWWYSTDSGYLSNGFSQIDGKWYYFSTQGSYRLLEGPCDEPFEVDESQYS